MSVFCGNRVAEVSTDQASTAVVGKGSRYCARIFPCHSANRLDIELQMGGLALWLYVSVIVHCRPAGDRFGFFLRARSVRQPCGQGPSCAWPLCAPPQRSGRTRKMSCLRNPLPNLVLDVPARACGLLLCWQVASGGLCDPLIELRCCTEQAILGRRSRLGLTIRAQTPSQ